MPNIRELYNISFSKLKFISLTLFLINPILSLFFSCFNYIKGKDTSLVLAMSLSAIFIYFPIMYDTSNNFFIQYYNSDTEISNLYIVTSQFARGIYNLQYYNVVFVFTALALFFWFKTINFLNSKGKIKPELFVMIIVPFVSLNYRDIMDLNRNFFSFAILLYALIYVLEKRGALCKIKFYVFIFLSIAVHLASAGIFLIYTICNFWNLKYKQIRFLFILSIVLSFFMPMILQVLSNFFSAFEGGIIGRLSYYLYSKQFGVQAFSLGTALKKIFNIIVILITGVICLKIYKFNRDDKTLRFILVLICLALIFSSYVTFFERLILAITLFYPYVIFTYDININLKKILLTMVLVRTVALSIFIYMPIFFGDYKDVLPDYNSKLEIMAKPFYYNTLLLLDVDNGYSDLYLINKDKWRY